MAIEEGRKPENFMPLYPRGAAPLGRKLLKNSTVKTTEGGTTSVKKKSFFSALGEQRRLIMQKMTHV